MATILEQYTQTKQQLTQQINAQQFPPEQLMYYQELLYRINVLETCMTFCKTAPVTADQRVLGNHYRIVDAYLICLLQERRFGYPADPQQKAQREAAHSNDQHDPSCLAVLSEHLHGCMKGVSICHNDLFRQHKQSC